MRGCRPLTRDEFNRIIWACKQLFHRPARERNIAIFTVMLGTGLRIGEAIRVRVQDVYQNGRLSESIYLEKRYSKTKLCGRTLPLPELVRDALKRWLRFSEVHRRGGSAWLFPACIPGPSDRPLYKDTAVNDRTIRKALDSVKAALGLTGKVNTHSFRKTFAHRMYELLDKDLFAVQEALRHEEIQSTLAYLSVNASTIREAAMRLFD